MDRPAIDGCSPKRVGGPPVPYPSIQANNIAAQWRKPVGDPARELAGVERAADIRERPPILRQNRIRDRGYAVPEGILHRQTRAVVQIHPGAASPVRRERPPPFGGA